MRAQKVKERAATVRTSLASVIPLKSPYLVQVFPVYACNFKCNYCIHSIDRNKRGFVASQTLMDFELYKKCIDDLTKFPEKIKMLRFAATGEPLLHPQLPEMIDYAKERAVADSVEIVTNGSLLTPDLSYRLISAGLDWLRVSVEGVTEERYKEVCGVAVNMSEFITNLDYFYQHRNCTKVYIKIIDIELSDSEKKHFYSLFGNICDSIAIEHLTPAVSEIDYSQLTSRDLVTTQSGNPVFKAEVCPQPFYMLQINPDGNVVPCCSMETATIIGNYVDQSLREIWEGQAMSRFRRLLLNGQKSRNSVCAKCENYRYGMFEEDVLDHVAEMLLKVI